MSASSSECARLFDVSMAATPSNPKNASMDSDDHLRIDVGDTEHNEMLTRRVLDHDSAAGNIPDLRQSNVLAAQLLDN